ncbi:MAG: haloacid dehalogenase-like hydrolase [Acidobacteria bacterium]|jgi:phosphoserine phosphatase|nr:haloacid dehalogenase-like hydrolase [Acidobacteriota bacterium]
MNSKNLSHEQTKSLIPYEWMQRIEAVEHCLKDQQPGPGEKIAVFDLDNTLLEGDIGEAVFTQLKIDEKDQPLTVTKTMIPFTWPQYHELIKQKKKKEAYARMVTAMAGIPVETVFKTTQRVMNSPKVFLEVEGVKVTVPRPNPVMQALVRYLLSLGYTAYIISATNSFSVQYVAENYFGIPYAQAFGMQPVLTREKENDCIILGDTIDGPVTVGEGKVEAYRRFIGTLPPLVTAGDSESDLQLLNLTSAQGFCIWVAVDEDGFDSVKKMLHSCPAYLLKRDI